MNSDIQEKSSLTHLIVSTAEKYGLDAPGLARKAKVANAVAYRLFSDKPDENKNIGVANIYKILKVLNLLQVDMDADNVNVEAKGDEGLLGDNKLLLKMIDQYERQVASLEKDKEDLRSQRDLAMQKSQQLEKELANLKKELPHLDENSELSNAATK